MYNNRGVLLQVQQSIRDVYTCIEFTRVCYYVFLLFHLHYKNDKIIYLHRKKKQQQIQF